VNDVLNIDFKLQVGNAAETVEVTGATPLAGSLQCLIAKCRT